MTHQFPWNLHPKNLLSFHQSHLNFRIHLSFHQNRRPS
jgi:hypothetical protein